MQTIASTTLGLKPQALAVLAMLAQQEPDFAPYDEKQHEYDYDCTTSAWYNGRENGISLVVRPRFRKVEKSLVITFSEVRNSDDIFIDSWEDSSVYFLNPPTISDWPETAYKSRKTVRYGRVDLAVEVIREKIKEFYASLPAKDAIVAPIPRQTLDLDDDEPQPQPLPSRRRRALTA